MSTEQRFLYLFPEQVRRNERGVFQLDWGAERSPFHLDRGIDYNPAVNEIVVRHKALSAAECAKVMALGEARTPVTATLERGHAVEYRASTIRWIEPDEDAQWLYHRLGILFHEVNRHFRFDLIGLPEALQYTVYGPGDKFEWHIDIGPGTISGRKLSVSILLSADADYEGGGLDFLNAGGDRSGIGIGTAIFFPSYMAHRVAPVTRGTRRSLVAWGYGPSFR
ncbi:MAG: 2OG-Fe(II) oxygenase [Burkholderiales bacterium]